MNRRRFLKLSLASSASMFLPHFAQSAPLSAINNVQFDNTIYSANQPQIIMVFLYGGASELSGNFTNFNTFSQLSQSSYQDHFGSQYLRATSRGFWEAAGGEIMEELVDSGDLSVMRTCYSAVRERENNRSHGSCVMQNQRGSFDEYTSGIFATLAEILKRNGKITPDSFMPILSMEGNSGFFDSGGLPLDYYLKPLHINENLNNPYKRSHEPSYADKMDKLAQSLNPDGKIKEAFTKRTALEAFINSIDDTDPAEANYPSNNSFAAKLKTSIDIMVQNRETKIISTGSGGLGGWDDHNDAENYLDRMENLFEALRSANIHLKSVDPQGHISILVMGEFGRGVNLNSAMGWDHGNLQNLFVLRGQRFFNSLGAYGHTTVNNTGRVNRLYLKPANGSYWFEPLAVASTIYSIFGVRNPSTLCDGISPISPLIA